MIIRRHRLPCQCGVTEPLRQRDLTRVRTRRTKRPLLSATFECHHSCRSSLDMERPCIADLGNSSPYFCFAISLKNSVVSARSIGKAREPLGLIANVVQSLQAL